MRLPEHAPAALAGTTLAEGDAQRITCFTDAKVPGGVGLLTRATPPRLAVGL